MGGGCCHYQSEKYFYRGLSYGFSPDDYMNKLLNFTVQGKHLQFIKAHYDSFFCLNVINSLTFGNTLPATSNITILGGKRGRDYMIPPNGLPPYQIDVFSHLHLNNTLTFFYFKYNIMCRDQPWIC